MKNTGFPPFTPSVFYSMLETKILPPKEVALRFHQHYLACGIL